MSERSPLREPMVWLMVGLPAVSVIAGIGLVVAAVRSGGADQVSDKVQRTAQIQVTELGPDARAQAMKLSAVLRLEANAVDVLPVNGEFARDQALVLRLSHPTDAALDRKLTLQPTTLGWRAAGDLRASHDWIAQLAPGDGHWRVHGRIEAGQRASYLGPALVGD
ncbi:MAG: FixH family protein [Arenimonas sp.]|jgi:hypothetical protein